MISKIRMTRFISVILTLAMIMSVVASVAPIALAEGEGAGDASGAEGAGDIVVKAPKHIELYNDPLLRDENGVPFDKGNPWWNADPEIHFFEGKYWVYATRSAPCERQLNQDCFSSEDLKVWTKHEAIIDEASVPDAWRSYWAPTVAYKDGFYYILFGTNDLNLGSATAEYSTGDVGGMYLLRSDKPEGPFKQFMGKGVPLIPDNIFGAQAIDAGMFLDDDNTMYLVYGGWSTCLMAKFKDDMTGFVPLGEENWKKNNATGRDSGDLNEFTDYFVHLTNYGTAALGELNYNASFMGTNETLAEGPVIYKIDGLYYLMFAVGGWTTDTYGIRYAIARNPLGPYTTIPGRFIQTRYSASSRGTGHHSMVYIEENDLWLNMYHRRPINGGTNDRYVALDVAHTYEGEVTLVDYDPTRAKGSQVFLESTPTRVMLFEPTIPTFYWSSDNPLPKNLAGYAQNTLKVGVKPSHSADGQSSNTTTAGRAFDGGINTASYWQSANANAGHWLQVDFGEATTYNELHIYLNQLGTGTGSIANTATIQIQKSDNGTNWTDIVETGATPGRTLLAAERVRRDGSYYFVRQAFTEAQTSRYLRLYFPDAQTVGVHEFEVYNIKSVSDLIALENGGAKIEEVNPGAIPGPVPASVPVAVSGISPAPASVSASNVIIDDAEFGEIAEVAEFGEYADQVDETASITSQSAAITAMADEFDDAPVIKAAALDTSEIGSIVVVPGSGLRGSTDPNVVFDDGYYYYARTENETSVTVAKSRRLEDIGKVGKTTVWAPDYDQFKLLRSPRLQKIGDKWYLYVSASDGDDHREERNQPGNLWNDDFFYNIYALESDSPMGPFEMKGMITKPDQSSTDGVVLQHPNGKNYFVWSGQEPPVEEDDPNAPAIIVKVSSSTTNPLDQGVAGMFDGSLTTKMYTDGAFVYGASQAPNGGLNIDVEYSKPITINGFRIGTAGDYYQRDPRQWTICGSNDGINWDPPFYTANSAADSSLLPTTRNVFTYFPREGTDAPFEVTYQYFRMNVTSVRTANNGFQISELNFIQTNGDTPLLPAAGKPVQSLYISEMSNPWTLTGAQNVISKPTLSWETGSLANNAAVAINEGPAPLIRDDGVYMFYSANYMTHTGSAIGMLKADLTSDPLNIASWTKSATALFRGGSSTTINNTNGVFYVRQPCVVKSPDGTEDWLLYQAGARSYGNAAGNSTNTTQIRQYLNSMKDRSVRMQKIEWSTEGVPSFAVATTGTSALAGNAAMTTQIFPRPSGSDGSDIYLIEAEDANSLTGVINATDRTTATTNFAGLRARSGIVSQWQRGGNESTAGSQSSASGGYGTYWNASGGLAVRLGKTGLATYQVYVDKAGTYNLTLMGVALEYNAKQIVTVNGDSQEITHTLYSQRYGGLFTPQTITVELDEGNNAITVANKAGGIGAVLDYLYLELVDATEEELTAGLAFTVAPGGESLSLKAVIETDIADAKGVVVYVAFYDADGRLIRVVTTEAVADVVGEYNVYEISVSDVPVNAAKVKAFAWNSVSAPLMDAETLALT